jgi:RNA polymerase sigma factor (sigma-70 family)
VADGAGDDDAPLVERARAGDPRAFSALVERHQRAAVRLAQALSGLPADAEDIAQEAFVKGYRSLDRFRPGAPFRPWLLTIVANEARNRRRAAGRRGHYELRLVEDRSRRSEVGSPEIATEVGAQRAQLLAAVAGLPPRQRDVVACRYLLELSEAETAQVLGVSAGTVKSHLARALDRLREEVDDRD